TTTSSPEPTRARSTRSRRTCAQPARTRSIAFCTDRTRRAHLPTCRLDINWEIDKDRNMTYIYLETETSALDATRHQVWEMAYAIDDEPVRSALVRRTVVGADQVALEDGRYYEGGG